MGRKNIKNAFQEDDHEVTDNTTSVKLLKVQN